MTPPFLVFLLTLVGCAFIALHSAWRLLLREQFPSVVHVGMTIGTAYAAWLLLRDTDMQDFLPDGRAIVLLVFVLVSSFGIHIYELMQSHRINPTTGDRGVPYDGMFSRFGGRWAPQKHGRPVQEREPL
jgi:hypothetical protein